MEKQFKIICLVALVLLVITLPAAAIPSVIGSGVSRIDPNTLKLLESKDTWKKSESGQTMAVWIQIPPGSDIKWDKAGCTNAASGCTGSVQCFVQWRIFTPDGKDWLKDYKSDFTRGLYDTNQGKIYLAHAKFFRDVNGVGNSNLPDEYGGPYYAVSELISPSYQWQGKWKVETYIHDAIANPRTSTLVNTQYFTLVDDSAQTTTPTAQTTTVPYTYGYVTPTYQQTTTASGSVPAVIDSGTSTFNQENWKILQPKNTWKASDVGDDRNIAAWIRIPGFDQSNTHPPVFEYRLFTPDGKDWFKDIRKLGDYPGQFSKVNVDGEMVFTSGVDGFKGTDRSSKVLEYGIAYLPYSNFLPGANVNAPPYQYEGTWKVDMLMASWGDRGTKYTKVKTLTFNLQDGGTTPGVTPITPSQAGLGYIEAESYTSADVQKTGATWDSVEEKCPTWRGNDWSGTGDYYLSHGGDTLSYSFNVPDSAKYAMWMRDWSDTNHAKGDRQITVIIDGATIGTFDAAYSFNKGTTGYGWDKLTNVDLSAGSHTMKITKKDTTSSAAVIDDFFFTPDLNEMPKGAIGHSEALCSGTTKAGTTTPQAGITPYIPPVVVSACSGTGTSVYAEDRTMQQGSTVKIPIMVCNANDLANMDLVVSYDTSVLKFRSAEKGGLNANSLFESNMASPGTVMISFASSTGNSGSASIALLSFDVIGSNGSISPIKITVKTASTSSGSSIPVTVSQGTFTTGTPAKVTFDGGPVTSRDALAALQMAVGKIPIDMKYDVTKDGSVNSGDARAILKIAVSSQ